MCDTLVAVGTATADGTVLLAKNSDREPNEAQALVHVPGAIHPQKSRLSCTYVALPQAPETHATFLSKPFWMWGCEMGVNAHGVAVGNEAVFTKEPYARDGLLGMDLQRLALERARTAAEALDVITELLARYGQGGDGGYQHRFYYHNAFVLADPRAAWVLETAGQYWAAFKVRDVYAISNGLTIGRTWDRASPGLVEHAIDEGWCSSEEDFHFADCYSAPLYRRLSRCDVRQGRAITLLRHAAGAITPATMMEILRDHGAEPARNPPWDPVRGSERNICKHAGFGPLRRDGTVSAWVAHLDPALPTIWSTASAAPCTALFKPFWPEALPALEPEPGPTYDPASLWWQHERLHRAVLKDYAPRLAAYREARDRWEAQLYAAAQTLRAKVRDLPPQERAERLRAFSTTALERARRAEDDWLAAVQDQPARWRWPSLYRLAWRGYNRRADLPRTS